MAATAGVLAALTAAGLTTPATLLALTFVLGCGQAVTGPAWQAIQPELVERRQIPAAATLGSLTVNLARAVGPAAAGLIVAATGPAAVFTINAVSFVGVVAALAASAALLGLAGASVASWPLRPTTGRLDRTVSAHWPDPALVFEPDPDDGPVLVVRRYRVPPESQAAFLEAMRWVGNSRRRTGATRWDVYRDGGSADGFTEVFSVRSWGEHLRQHADRLTGADREFEQRAAELAVGDLEVEHLFPPHVQAAVAPDPPEPPD